MICYEVRRYYEVRLTSYREAMRPDAAQIPNVSFLAWMMSAWLIYLGLTGAHHVRLSRI